MDTQALGNEKRTSNIALSTHTITLAPPSGHTA